MLDSFHKYNTENQLFRPEDKLLVAVSGGIDSVVLCHLLHAAHMRFAIAHCNFGLRGDESDGDEAFVKNLADQFQVPIHVKRFDTTGFKKAQGISTQMAARDLRYQWFDELIDEHGYTRLCLAQHQNDLFETVLLNLVRGTGIAGLHGIRAQSGNRIRPLLFADKATIVAYAHQNKIAWREDSSNQSSDYQRNFLRHDVIPLLKKLNPNLEQTFEQSIRKISAAENIFTHYIERLRQQHVIKKDSAVYIDYSFLTEEKEPVLVLFELLRPYQFNYVQAQNIVELLHGEAGKSFLSATHLLVKDRQALIITPVNSKSVPSVWLHATGHSVALPQYSAALEASEYNGYTLTADPFTAYLNYDKVQFPLTIRPWQAGDRFRPLGMKGKKNISDFLNDLKIPLNLKKDVLVVLSQNEVIWVVGHRIDERYKALNNTKSLLLRFNLLG
jgi:tRNA(Ile)-lysidine synthase